MSGPTVQLEWAFSWRCPRCRRTFFSPFLHPPLPYDEFNEKFGEEEDGDKLELPWEASQEDASTVFMSVPNSVICPTCSVEFNVKLPRGMDDLDGDDLGGGDDGEDWKGKNDDF